MSQPDKTEEGDIQYAIDLYIAYNDGGANPWKNFMGNPCPLWVELPSDVQAKWQAVARYVRKVPHAR